MAGPRDVKRRNASPVDLGPSGFPLTLAGSSRSPLGMGFPTPLRAVVTGAGGGLGRALSLELAGRGARLVVSDIDGIAPRAWTPS